MFCKYVHKPIGLNGCLLWTNTNSDKLRKVFCENHKIIIDNFKFHNEDFSIITRDRCISWYESHSTSERRLHLYNMSYKNNLTQLINDHTRYSTNGAYLLDLISVDQYNYITDTLVQPTLLNLYQCTVYRKLNFKVSKLPGFKRRVWDYKSADFNGSNATLSNASLETTYTIFDDVDDIVNYTNALIL